MKVLRFVDAPRAGARVLFDLATPHDVTPGATNTSTGRTISFGAPTLAGDNGAPGRAYGERTLRIPMEISGERTNTEAVLAALAPVVLRRQAWLEVQTAPGRDRVWWKCFPGSAELDWTQVYDDPTRPSTWGCDLQIPAAPFGIGETVTIAPKTLGFDPSTGGCTVELPPIAGDVAAPLTMLVEPDATWGAEWRVLWSTAATLPGVESAPVWFDPTLPAMNPGVGAGPVQADPKFPGGGYRDITPSSVLAAPTYTLNAAPLRPGRFLVLQRLGAVVESPGYVELDVTAHTQEWLPRERVRFISVDRESWGVLGEIAHPRNVDMDALDESDVSVPLTHSVRAQLRAASAAVPIRVGGLLLLQVDGPGFESVNTLLSQPGQILVGESARWDGETESIVRRTASGSVYGLSSPNPAGSWPMVLPKFDNRVNLVPKTNTPSTSTTDVPAATATVTFSYRPRHYWFPSPSIELGKSA